MEDFIYLDSINNIDSSENITIFLSEFICLFISAKSNTSIFFPLIDALKP